jgi:uracil-DNA glycosylase family 4
LVSVLGTCKTCDAPIQGIAADGSAVPCGHVVGSISFSLKEPAPAPTDDNPFGKPEKCRPCPLFLEPGIVPAKGPQNAKILALGEAPGADEVDTPHFRPDRMGPFQGGSGRVLTVLFAHAGIRRSDVRIRNVVQCRPPGNRTPTPDEIACCFDAFVREEIEGSPANVILALGDTPLGLLTGRKGIGLYRGVPTAGYNGRKVFPTWHPAFIIRSQHLWAFEVHDLARAAAQSAFPEIRRVPFTIVRQADPASTSGGLLDAVRARGACTFDFETTGLSAVHDQIRMCGIAGGPGQAYVYDWTPRARAVFDSILADPRIEVCGQNILYFDLPFAEEKAKGAKEGFWTHPQAVEDLWKRRIFDTMVAFHLCNSSYGQTSIASQNKGSYQGARGAEKDLAFIASNHTDMEYWKGRENYRDDIYTVCGKDVIATDRSAYDPQDGLKAELKRYDMTDLYYKHVLPVHLPLHRMHQRGMRIDQDRAQFWAVGMSAVADELEETFKQGVGDPYLNLDSPKQLMEVLYGKLGLPVQYLVDKKRGMRPTANAEALEVLAALAPENVGLQTLVEIRHLRKMVATYLREGLESGWLHPLFGVSKAANGRFNSQNPNSQNVPEEMRDIWVPDDDEHVVLSADASQIEWRVAMVLSGDPVGLKLLASGVDNHRAVAAEAFQKPLSEIDDATRHGAKFIVYGLGYGRGAQSIADGHKLDIDFVRLFIRNFAKRFSTFWAWREALPDFVLKHHFLANPFKRRRWWYTREITEIYNYPASSTAADMMIDEVIQLEDQLPREATLRLTVHDEVVIVTPKDIVNEVARCVRDVMEQKWPQIVEASAYPETVRASYPGGWYCPVDVHVGSNWGMTKSKDPEMKRRRAELEKHLGFKS